MLRPLVDVMRRWRRRRSQYRSRVCGCTDGNDYVCVVRAFVRKLAAFARPYRGTAGKFVGGEGLRRDGGHGGGGAVRSCSRWFVCVRSAVRRGEVTVGSSGNDGDGGRGCTLGARVSEGEARESAAAVYNSGSSVALATFRVQYNIFLFFFVFPR